MGLFSKKEKPRCPICGGETSFLSGTAIADGETICKNCEQMLRGQYDLEHYWVTHYNRQDTMKTSDPLSGMTVEDIRAIIAEKKQAQAQAVAELGGDYANLLKADEVFSIAPKATEVGLKRAKLLKDRCVVRGMVMAGEFSQGDTVKLLHGAQEMKTVILELLPCDGAVDFKTTLAANMHGKTAPVNTNAWLILDLTGAEPAQGDMLVR